MIEARNLTRTFGARTAVNDISFRIEPGTVAAFLGPNGAGKTTTMRLLTGFLQPDSGTAAIGGHDIADSPLTARAGFGYLPEAASGLDDLTILELLMFAAESRRFWGARRDAEISRVTGELDLGPQLDRVMRQLSKGWRQRAWFAQALIGDPPALILDEPTDGLDPLQQTVMHRMIKDMAPRKAILLSTHVLATAETLATRVIIMAAGRIVADAPPRALADANGRLGAAFERVAGAALSAQG
jgi:ABC-2 type transport system ATP-binding protein